MSDRALWLRRIEDEEEAYEATGYPIPPGHPDEGPAELEELDRLGRYFDAPEPWCSPVRVSDDWDLDEDLDVAA